MPRDKQTPTQSAPAPRKPAFDAKKEDQAMLERSKKRMAQQEPEQDVDKFLKETQARLDKLKDKPTPKPAAPKAQGPTDADLAKRFEALAGRKPGSSEAEIEKTARTEYRASKPAAQPATKPTPSAKQAEQAAKPADEKVTKPTVAEAKAPAETTPKQPTPTATTTSPKATSNASPARPADGQTVSPTPKVSPTPNKPESTASAAPKSVPPAATASSVSSDGAKAAAAPKAAAPGPAANAPTPASAAPAPGSAAPASGSAAPAPGSAAPAPGSAAPSASTSNTPRPSPAPKKPAPTQSPQSQKGDQPAKNPSFLERLLQLIAKLLQQAEKNIDNYLKSQGQQGADRKNLNQDPSQNQANRSNQTSGMSHHRTHSSQTTIYIVGVKPGANPSSVPGHSPQNSYSEKGTVEKGSRTGLSAAQSTRSTSASKFDSVKPTGEAASKTADLAPKVDKTAGLKSDDPQGP